MTEQFYAIADFVPHDVDYLTAGKPYMVRNLQSSDLKFPVCFAFNIVNDDGRVTNTVEKRSSHLKGANWRLVKESDLTLAERSLAGLTTEEEEDGWTRTENDKFVIPKYERIDVKYKDGSVTTNVSTRKLDGNLRLFPECIRYWRPHREEEKDMSEIEQNSWTIPGHHMSFNITKEGGVLYPLIGWVFNETTEEYFPSAWDKKGNCLLCAEASTLSSFNLQPLWPKYGDFYWYVNSSGHVSKGSFTGKKPDQNRKDLGNFFKYAEGAVMAAEEVKNIFSGFKNGEL